MVVRRLFDPALFAQPEQALDFVSTILQAQTEYSLIGMDLEGAIVLWNEGARRLYGYDPADVIGVMSARNLFTDKDNTAGLQERIFKAALEDGKWEGMLDRVRKNGEVFAARALVTPRVDARGNVVGVVWISRDVTDEVKAQEKFKGLLESAPDAMVIVDKAGKIVIVNAQAEKLFGYRRAELLGQPVEILVPQRFTHGHPVYRENYFRDPKLRPMGSGRELFGKRKDGSEFSVEISLSPLETEEGTLVTSTIRDITERKASEAKFRGLLESAPDAMVIVDKAGKIVIVNGQAETLFGYHREELLGKNVEILVPRRYEANHPRYRDGYFRDPKLRPMGSGRELFGKRKDGTEFSVEISLSPLQTEEGMLVTSIIRDISERKRYERQLQDKNVELKNLSLAKDRFLASMSHELRTPLNAILGFTGTLLMKLPGPLTPDQEKQLGTVQSSGRHLLSLINDLLDLAKIESGKVEVKLEPVDAREVLKEVFDTLAPMAKEKGLAYDVRFEADEEFRVRIDRRALSQILFNLANNAVKFTEAGGVRLGIGRRDGSIQISVEDTGIGISAADQAKLFQAFTQLDSAVTRKYGGTGLGLYLSDRLAKLMGGEITFSSEPARGSRFTVRLPNA